MRLVRLEGWSVIREDRTLRFDGKVFNHPHLRNGRRLITDIIIEMRKDVRGAAIPAFLTMWSLTGDYAYVLGDPAEWFLKKYPGSPQDRLTRFFDNRLL